MNDTGKLCIEDSRLQRKLKRGEITKAEYDFKIKRIQKSWSEQISINGDNEEEFLQKLIKKHGGN